ncbi:MAG: chemotaxis protein CheW [Candidatus Hodarchaeota archaeon]
MPVSSSELNKSGKYLIFGIADDLYGLEVGKLKEVFQTDRILKLPRTSELLAGIVNLRGVIISVFDLSILLWGKKLGVKSKGSNGAQSDQLVNVLLTTIKGQEVGILVDHIHHLGEITKFDEKNTAELEKKGFLNTSVITKVGQLEDERKIFVLDLVGLLTDYVSSTKRKVAIQKDDDLDFDFSQYTLPDPEESFDNQIPNQEDSYSDTDIEMFKLPEEDEETFNEFDFEEKASKKKKSKKE